LVRVLHGAMIGQCNPIDGDATPALAQALGHETSQQGIEGGFERIEVAQLCGEFTQHGRPRGSPIEVVAGLVDRKSGGGGKDHDMEEVADLYPVTAGLQGQRSQSVDSHGQHILAIQGILGLHAQRDSPNEGLNRFLSLSENPFLF